MADPLIQYLLNQQMQNAKENPFVTGAQQIQSLPVYDKRFSTGNNIAAGALQGLAAGLLGGYGRNEVEQKNAQNYKDLTNALQTGDFSANPDLANIGQVYKLQEAQQNKEQALAQALLEQKAKYAAPKIQNFIDGDQQVQKQWDPSTQSFIELGRGPRFNPNLLGNGASTETVGALADLLPSLGMKDDTLINAQKAINNAGSAAEARRLFSNFKETAELNLRQSGGTPKPVDKDTRETVTKAMNLQQKSVPLLDMVSKVEANYPKKNWLGNATEITKDEFLKRLPATERKKTEDWLNYLAINVAVDTLGKQGLSNTDAAIFKNFLTGSGAIAMGDLTNRLGFLIENSRTDAANSLGNAMAGGNIDEFGKKLTSRFLKSLPEKDRPKYNDMIFMGEAPFEVTLSADQAKNLPDVTGSEEDFKKAITKVAGAAASPSPSSSVTPPPGLSFEEFKAWKRKNL